MPNLRSKFFEKRVSEGYGLVCPEYLGQFVAIYKGRIVDVDSDKGCLIKRVRKTFGSRVFIMKVEEDRSPLKMPTGRRLLSHLP